MVSNHYSAFHWRRKFKSSTFSSMRVDSTGDHAADELVLVILSMDICLYSGIKSYIAKTLTRFLMPRKGSCLVMLRGNHDNWVLSQAAGLLDSAKETKSKVSNSAITDEFSNKGILLDGREIAVKKLSDTLTQGI
ncbi:hypothetical protein WN943_003204 [Citrus x changshan-huyou]